MLLRNIQTSPFIFVCEYIGFFFCLKWVELSIINQIFLVRIVGSAKCIWSRWSPILMTRSVKCPANVTGVSHLWSVSCGLTRTMTMCLLVKSLTFFHQKLPWMQQELCYLFPERKLLQKGSWNAQQGHCAWMSFSVRAGRCRHRHHPSVCNGLL